MRFVDKKSKLDYLIEMINKEATGKVEDICSRIHVSRRTCLRYIVDLKELGYNIGYCKTRNTYYIIKNIT